MAIAECTLPAAPCGAQPVLPQPPVPEVQVDIRRLTVSYSAPESRWPLYLVHYMPKLKPSACLRLRGRWFERAGFAIGSKVSVQVMPKRLVIELTD